jgi:glutamyl-tRNA synthetase
VEIFDLKTLTEKFSIERVHKGGAKFDFEKAKWFNQEWIKKSSDENLIGSIKSVLAENGIETDDALLIKIIPLVKERCQLLSDFILQTSYFFKDPSTLDLSSVLPKWDESKTKFFENWSKRITSLNDTSATSIEQSFKESAAESGIKPGELQLPFRIMLVGGKFGPPVFEIAALIGIDSTCKRIRYFLNAIKS